MLTPIYNFEVIQCEPDRVIIPIQDFQYAVDSALAAGASKWTLAGSDIHRGAGNVGIGTNAPAALLHIKGAPPTFIFETTSTTGKGRVASVVGNWLGNTVNNSFDGVNWNLDDTSVAGWIQKLDARSAHDRFEIARLSVGANPRTYTPLMTLLGSGHLGINTVTPRKQIDSLSTSQAQLRLTYTDHATTPVCVDFLANGSGNLVVTPRAASAAGVNITLGKNGHMSIAGAALDIFANGGFASSIGLSHDEDIIVDISEMPKVGGVISYLRLNPSTNQPTPGSGSTAAPNGAEAYALRGLCQIEAVSTKNFNEIYGAEGIALHGGSGSLISGFGSRSEYTHFGPGNTTTAAASFSNFRTGTGATGTVTDALANWSRVNLEHALNVGTARCIIADFRNTGGALISGSVTLVHGITPIINSGLISGSLYGFRIQDLSAFSAFVTGKIFNIKSFGANAWHGYEGKSSFGSANDPVSIISILVAPVASANFGTISLGSGPFDGTASGFFTGSSNGTQFAINAASGSTADLANWQVAGVDRFRVTSLGNVGIKTGTFGTSAQGVLGIANGTEPSTSPADMVQLYSVDLSAGNATLGLRTETAVVTEAVVSDRTLSIKINGTVFKILLKI